MVKALGSGSPWFRMSSKTKTAHDNVFKYDSKKGMRFPTKVKSDENTFAASAGPFSFKAEKSKESTFTWTPLAAELEVGASFGLKVATSAEYCPGMVQIGWKPALPGRDGRLIAGAIAALTGAIGAITGMAAMGAEGKSGDTVAEMSSYAGLIAAAAALLAAQQNMSFKLVLSPALDFTLHPLLVAKKTEGKEWKFGPMENKTTGFKKEKNETDLLVAVGLMKANGSDNSNSVSSVNAIANRNGVSGNANKS